MIRKMIKEISYKFCFFDECEVQKGVSLSITRIHDLYMIFMHSI
jgi:hypothetical protein